MKQQLATGIGWQSQTSPERTWKISAWPGWHQPCAAGVHMSCWKTRGCTVCTVKVWQNQKVLRNHLFCKSYITKATPGPSYISVDIIQSEHAGWSSNNRRGKQASNRVVSQQTNTSTITNEQTRRSTFQGPRRCRIPGVDVNHQELRNVNTDSGPVWGICGLDCFEVNTKTSKDDYLQKCQSHNYIFCNRLKHGWFNMQIFARSTYLIVGWLWSNPCATTVGSLFLWLITPLRPSCGTNLFVGFSSNL